LVIQPADIAD